MRMVAVVASRRLGFGVRMPRGRRPTVRARYELGGERSAAVVAERLAHERTLDRDQIRTWILGLELDRAHPIVGFRRHPHDLDRDEIVGAAVRCRLERLAD